MKIAIAADHAGHPVKDTVIAEVRSAGHEAIDLGTNDPATPSDYPDVAAAACTAILDGRAARGIVLCGSGVGVAITANKFPGIRAGVCHDTYSAHQAVEHDDMNVLCLGARVIGPEPLREIVRAFVAARYTGETRHARRLAKLLEIEARHLKR